MGGNPFRAIEKEVSRGYDSIEGAVSTAYDDVEREVSNAASWVENSVSNIFGGGGGGSSPAAPVEEEDPYDSTQDFFANKHQTAGRSGLVLKEKTKVVDGSNEEGRIRVRQTTSGIGKTSSSTAGLGA